LFVVSGSLGAVSPSSGEVFVGVRFLWFNRKDAKDAKKRKAFHAKAQRKGKE
jgi:hypothetical protein